MRILFLTENFPPEVNASATRVYERACYWVKAGHEVTVLTCFPNFPQGRVYAGYKQRLWQQETIDGIRVIRLPTYIARNEGFIRRTLDFVSFMVAAVFAAPWLKRPDVVVATSPQFFAAVAGWLVGLIKRRPFVFELGDLWPATILAVGAMRRGLVVRRLEGLELFLYKRAAAVVALTPAFRDNLISRGIPPGKIAVVVNGVDLSRYAVQARDGQTARDFGVDGKHVIGYIGTHGMSHDLSNAVRSAALLRDVGDFRLLFVGDGAEKPALRKLAAELNLENVKFIDPQPKSAMPNVWSVCDIALIHLKKDPVFAEVIPSKMFEAMAMGLPLLVVAPKGEASRIVEATRSGAWVEAGNPELLAAAVRRMLSDPDRLRAYASASLAAAPAYSRKRQADDMIKVLEAVRIGDGAKAAEALAP
jgi:glycosyltransferase involved in cell wall biosynthesis